MKEHKDAILTHKTMQEKDILRQIIMLLVKEDFVKPEEQIRFLELISKEE